jgi:hypothetical protein
VDGTETTDTTVPDTTMTGETGTETETETEAETETEIVTVGTTETATTDVGVIGVTIDLRVVKEEDATKRGPRAAARLHLVMTSEARLLTAVVDGRRRRRDLLTEEVPHQKTQHRLASASAELLAGMFTRLATSNTLLCKPR